jgi:hypothetical protein
MQMRCGAVVSKVWRILSTIKLRDQFRLVKEVPQVSSVMPCVGKRCHSTFSQGLVGVWSRILYLPGYLLDLPWCCPFQALLDSDLLALYLESSILTERIHSQQDYVHERISRPHQIGEERHIVLCYALCMKMPDCCAAREVRNCGTALRWQPQQSPCRVLQLSKVPSGEGPREESLLKHSHVRAELLLL